MLLGSFIVLVFPTCPMPHSYLPKTLGIMFTKRIFRIVVAGKIIA
jgi:hypothetical protein